MILMAGLLLGLLGSAHCLGMCGPLVLAVGTPCGRAALGARLAYVGAYHAGRITTYAVLGVAAGLVGQLGVLAGVGRGLAIGGGSLMLAASLVPRLGIRVPGGIGPWTRAAGRASTVARLWTWRHPRAAPLAAGVANGLLPCGMVHAALGAAVITGSVPMAVGTMVAFGVGTVPALVGLSLVSAHVPIEWRRTLVHGARVGLGVVGALLLVRGIWGHSTGADPQPAAAPSAVHRHVP